MYSARRSAPPHCRVAPVRSRRPRTIFRAFVRTFVQVSSISLRCCRRLEYRALLLAVSFPPAAVSADAVAERGRAVAKVSRERLLLVVDQAPAAVLFPSAAEPAAEAEHLSSRAASALLSGLPQELSAPFLSEAQARSIDSGLVGS